MFSVIYYSLFRTRLFRIPRYFEVIVLYLHLKSTPLFRTWVRNNENEVKQQEETLKRPTKSEVRQAIETLSRYSLFAIEGAEIRRQTSQLSFTIAKSIRKKNNNNNNNRTFKDFLMQLIRKYELSTIIEDDKCMNCILCSS